jgi:Holliday junction resolvase-like predicted endonuclease
MKKIENVNITKASGDRVPFSEDRLRRSLLRSGAAYDQVEHILNEVRGQLFEGMPTKKIYKIAFALLKEGSRHLAARYHLKQAIMELGPSGFPFEQYIAGIMQRQGYTVKTGQFVHGQCVDHEIDVIAEKEDKYILVECKYHNFQGVICNVRIPLYIHARYMDVQKKWSLQPQRHEKEVSFRIVTNTRFSEDAIRYANCAGLELLGWDFPARNSLKEQIDASGLYPITCLTALTKAEKQKLLDRKIVQCSELIDNERLLASIGVSGTRSAVVLHEVEQLCSYLADGKQEKPARINKSNYTS